MYIFIIILLLPSTLMCMGHTKLYDIDNIMFAVKTLRVLEEDTNPHSFIKTMMHQTQNKTIQKPRANKASTGALYIKREGENWRCLLGCDTIFTTYAGCYKHIRRRHLQEAQLCCPWCYTKFLFKADIHKHTCNKKKHTAP